MNTGEPINRRALGRALSRAANASVAEVLARNDTAAAGAAARIAITGAPGAGKSTLISLLAKRRLARRGRLGVLAIDPTSPLTRGSILGDRIRMDNLANDPGVFIRSIPSRGAHDGLSNNTADLLNTMERVGFDEVIVETVGVGQADYTVRMLVDTVVLVLVPGAGDAIQAMKAGILEMADIYVVNKSDLDGAALMVAEINSVAERRSGDGAHDWAPPVIAATKDAADGFDALDTAIEDHLNWLAAHTDRDAVRRARARHHVHALLARRVGELMDSADPALFDHAPHDIYTNLVARLADTGSD